MKDLADIAAEQIGKHEDGDSNRGSQIAAFQAATTLGAPDRGDGYPWCCAFVDWCIEQWIAQSPGLLSCEKARPRTASVAEFVNWGMRTGQCVFMPTDKTYAPRRNDIVAFCFPSGGHHIGIVTGSKVWDAEQDLFLVPTVEGNTNAAGSRDGGSVQAKKRPLPGSIWRFIRLAQLAHAVVPAKLTPPDEGAAIIPPAQS